MKRQLLILVPAVLFSAAALGRTTLYRKPSNEAQATEPKEESSGEQTFSPSPTTVVRPLPVLKKVPLMGARNWSMVTRGNPIVSSQGAVRLLSDFLPGDLRRALVPTSVIAFSEGKAPVIAEMSSISGKAYLLLGEATLEKTSKRITVEFTKIRQRDRAEVFSFKGAALADDGTLGLEGELHSGEAKYFLAELMSAAAAGFADSTVNRSTNSLGNSVEDQSLDTHTKKALSTAMARSADRFGEKLKNVTEYSLLAGPVSIQVLIQDQPKISHEGGK